MATPIETPSRLTSVTRSTRSGIKNFSRRFERKPKPLTADGIANLPPALGTRLDYLPPPTDGSNTKGEQQNEQTLQTNGSNSNNSIARTNGKFADNPDLVDEDEDEPGRNSNSTSPSLSPNIRAPTHRKPRFLRIFASSKKFKLPDLPWLCGTWHVTHSSMPVWRDVRNLKITYTRLTASGKLDDVIQYQSKDDASGRVERVRGVDSLNRDGSYGWKGKGKLTMGAVSASRWEVLGWGGGGSKSGMILEPEKHEQWLITYWAKTMFSPAGLSICSRGKRGLTERTMKKLMKGLRKVDKQMLDGNRGGQSINGRGDFGRMLDGLFVIPQADEEVGIVQGSLPT